MKTASTPLSFKAIIMVLIAALSAISSGANAAAARKGTEINKDFSIHEFTSVNAATGIEIVYTQGHFTGVAKVTTNTTAEKYLRIKVENGCLNAYFDTKGHNGNVNIDGKTIVMVQSPVLKEIDLSSAAKFRMNGPYTQNRELEIDLSSAASAYFSSLTCTKLDLDLSSAASFTADNLQGNVSLESSSASKASITQMKGTKLSVEVSSAANVTIAGFTGTSLLIQASSGAKVTASGLACKKADVSASSGGSVALSGNCENLSTSNSSGGRIKNDLSVSRLLSSGSDNYNSQFNKARLQAQKAQLAAQKTQLAAQRTQLAAQKQAARQIREEQAKRSEKIRKDNERIRKEQAKRSEKIRKDNERIRKEQAKRSEKIRKDSERIRKAQAKKKKEKDSSAGSQTTNKFVIP